MEYTRDQFLTEYSIKYSVKSQYRTATVLTFEFEVDEVVGKCELIHVQITVSEKCESIEGQGYSSSLDMPIMLSLRKSKNSTGIVN